MPRLPTIDTRQASAKPRMLVLCFDGTTNIYDDTNTNVVKLFSLLKRDNREEQMVYYQPGVGTYVPPGILLPITLQLAKIADQAIALYLDKHVMGGYEFLMKHYNDGDKICLFGFSRGAYTARALAGMLHKVGLLPPDNVEQISFAYQMYKRTGEAGFKESLGFKKTFSRQVEIEFVGVWDTVSSVGLLIPRHLPYTKFNPIVKTFRHAVSLDERRAKFRHNLWHTHSSGGQCAKSSTELESTKLSEPRVFSPTAQTTSPISLVTALRPVSKLRGSNLKEVIDITVTEATPSTDYERTPDTLVDPVWVGEQAGNLSPTDSREQAQGISLSQVWHPREPTQVDGSGPGVRKGDSRPSSASDVDHANTTLPTTKSDASLDFAKEGDEMVTETNGAKIRLLDRIINRLGSRTARTRSTNSSGAYEFEEAMDARFQTGHDEGKNARENDVLEVWFAGCHGDVGGGAESDTKKDQLSNISLRWMIRQIISSQCGIKFDAGALKAMHISPATVSFGMKAPSSRYSSPSDVKLVSAAQEQEYRDAMADMHDNVLKPAWWLLELVPLLHKHVDRKGDSRIKIRPNLFRGRRPHTFDEKIKVHRSVQYRMNYVNPDSNPADIPVKYEYKARIAEKEIEWVD